MRALAVGAVLACAPWSAIAGNFCLVPSFGRTECNFISLDHCQRSAEALRGQCVPNPSALPGSSSGAERQSPMGAMIEGMELGAQIRRSSEEHKARMRLLEAQIEATKAAAVPQPPQPSSDNGADVTMAGDFIDQCRTTLSISEAADPRPPPEEGFSVGSCIGYLTAFIEAHSMMLELAEAHPQFCRPRGAAGAFSTPVKELLRLEAVAPTIRTYPTGPVLLSAMKKVWPCS